jgi:hypothetical protein
MLASKRWRCWTPRQESCERDSGARRRKRAEVLFQASRSGACRNRSDWVDEVVFAPDGRAGNRLSNRSSGDDSSSPTPQTEARSARCRAAFKVAGRKPFSIDLATFEGTAGSPSVALAPSSCNQSETLLQSVVVGDCHCPLSSVLCPHSPVSESAIWRVSRMLRPRS